MFPHELCDGNSFMNMLFVPLEIVQFFYDVNMGHQIGE
jgi:hypothetical protein